MFAVAEAPSTDATGIVAGFADATGRFLPLVCTLNAGRVLSSTAAMLGTDLTGLDRLALQAAPGAGGWSCCRTWMVSERLICRTPPGR